MLEAQEEIGIFIQGNSLGGHDPAGAIRKQQTFT